MEDEAKAKKTEAILARVHKERGIVRQWPKLLAEKDPDFMESVHNLTVHPLLERHSLPRKFKEIIFVCLNAFDYYEFGFRVHVRGALAHGATEDEILEALELVGVQKLHSLTSMLPILAEEVEKFKAEQGSATGATGTIGAA